jgi:hypothetical protein
MDELYVTLFRPTGPQELELVRASGFRRWPPRLPDQPIFYPVTNQAYAAQIAREWNVPQSGYGCVTRFYVQKDFIDRYPVRKVGGRAHTEWWIPSEDLPAMNDHLVGLIEIVEEFSCDPQAIKRGE